MFEFLHILGHLTFYINAHIPSQKCADCQKYKSSWVRVDAVEYSEPEPALQMKFHSTSELYFLTYTCYHMCLYMCRGLPVENFVLKQVHLCNIVVLQ